LFLVSDFETTTETFSPTTTATIVTFDFGSLDISFSDYVR